MPAASTASIVTPSSPRWSRHAMIPNGGNRFRNRSCCTNSMARDDASKNSHALSRLFLAGDILGETEQPVRIAQHDALAATLDQALLLPAAERAAHGMQRRSGHLGDVLAADRKID